MSDPTTLGVGEAAAALRQGEVSAAELLEAYLERIDRLDPELNCFVTVDESGARRQAREADERRQAGTIRSPLDGVPLALKDNIDVAGLPTSNGTKLFRMATEDAHVVSRLRQAGAVLLGKLNMHECALGGTTDNPHHGPTHNPWRRGYTPGGSSGGSAAAVAARLCPAALGSDTMGSVRLPAGYCGISGMIATAGLISTRGVVPLGYGLDRVGPLCRSIGDLRLMIEVLAGFDANSPESVPPPEGWSPVPDEIGDLSGLRLGRLTNFAEVAQDSSVQSAFAATLELAQDLGAELVDLTLPDFDPAAVRRAGLLLVEAEANYALRDELESAPENFSDEIRAALRYGGEAPGWRLVKAGRAVAETGAAVRLLFAEVDLLVTPTAPQPAFPFTTPAPDNQAEFTATTNFAGCPALSLPCGLSTEGLPLGLHLVARHWREAQLLAAAGRLEHALDFEAWSESFGS
jgi:aspartyl-tRNA(Asn)/glutamyl-tRNA(Gln) amidotransferase subunit A